MIDKELRTYVVAEELINDKPSGFYTIRRNIDVSPARFVAIDSFDTLQEALDYIRYCRNKSIIRP